MENSARADEAEAAKESKKENPVRYKESQPVSLLVHTKLPNFCLHLGFRTSERKLTFPWK